MTLNKQIFFDNFKPWFKRTTGKALSARQVRAIDFLLGQFQREMWRGEVWGDPRNVAYALATIHVETYIPKTNQRYEPVLEQGPKSYFLRYDKSQNPKKAKELGNTEIGDGYRYRGRGYVQLTGRANYELFNIDHDPDAALNPQMAFEIMTWGMRDGDFTGKKLSDYINDKKTDYKGARRIINGQDRAQEIADYARDIEAILKLSAAAPATQDLPANEDDDKRKPSLQSAGQPSEQQQNLLDRATAPLIAVKAKFDTLGVNPGDISKSSAVTTILTKIGGWLVVLAGFVADRPVWFGIGAVLIIVAVLYLASAKRNATARVVNGVK